MLKSLVKFHSKTRTKSFDRTIPLDKWPAEWKQISYKGYIRLPQIHLAKPTAEFDKPFVSVLNERESVRDFSNDSISSKMLSNLLYYSLGVKPNIGKRFYASAGGRYPLETYLLITKKVGRDIIPGLYHYHIKSHSLESLWLDKEALVEMQKAINQKWASSAHVFILNTAVFSRTIDKYGLRGYRHILSETGYTGQNIYLVSTMLGLGCCAIGGYKDDSLNKLLDVDGVEESIVALYAIGRAKITKE